VGEIRQTVAEEITREVFLLRKGAV